MILPPLAAPFGVVSDQGQPFSLTSHKLQLRKKEFNKISDLKNWRHFKCPPHAA
jgi:hypothetical protein